MSGSNFNETSVKTLTTLDRSNGGVGGFNDHFTFTTSALFNTTSATPVDITGMTNQSFTTPVSGKHTFIMTIKLYGSGSNNGTFNGDLLIDESISVLFSTAFSFPADSASKTATLIGTVDLVAGEHTIRPRASRTTGGTSTLNIGNGYDWDVYVSASGSGINGLEIEETRRSADYTVTAAYVAAPGGGMLPVPDMSVDVNVLEGERVQISFVGAFRTAGASTNNDLMIGYQVDSDTPVPGGYSSNVTSESSNCSFTALTDPLSAGQHTIKLVAASSTAQDPSLLGYNGISQGTDCRFQVTRFKSFGIGAGTIVTSNSLGSTFDVVAPFVDVPGAGMAQVSTVQVTIDTIEGEEVEICFDGSMYAAVTYHGSVGYQIDSDTPVVVQWLWQNGARAVSAGFSVVSTPLSAGQHVIKLMASTSGGTPQIITSNSSKAVLHVTQFRGGLIPIQDEGVEIVDKPSAIDFVGDGVTVTQVGTKAQVSIPGGGSGPADKFVRRGDPATPDFELGDLTTDGSPHTLDLSSIIPVGATSVLLGGLIDPNGVASGSVIFYHGDSTNYQEDLGISGDE